MRINDTNPEFLRPEQLKGGREAGAEGAKAPQPATPIQRTDRVQISEAARALAANEPGESELTAERIAEIRQKILDGAYNSLESVEQVARRILASGDL